MSSKAEKPPTIAAVPNSLKLQQYAFSVILRETEIQKKLKEKIQTHEKAIMMGSPDEAQFLGLLCKILNAKKVIEVGVYMGYTTLALALQLPADGKVYALDISEEYANVAKPFWEEAGVGKKIDFKVGPASQTMNELIKSDQVGTFDLIFIDADKTGYDDYYEKSLKLLRPGGIIAIDNVLWGGSVINEDDKSEDTVAIRKLNAKIKTDTRVDISLLTIADGLTLCRKL